jgi:uncharacterized protein YkwD
VTGGQILWFSGKLMLVCLTQSMAVRAEPVLAEALPAAASVNAPANSCQAPVNVAWLLDQLNAWRSQGQSCGGVPKPAAPPLRWEPKLAHSAQAFATELAQRDGLSHVGTGGGGLRERFKRSGYLIARAGENLAAGQEELDEALQVWLDSAAHCNNLMQAEFRDVGLACAIGPGAYQRYWVMHLGRSVVTFP